MKESIGGYKNDEIELIAKEKEYLCFVEKIKIIEKYIKNEYLEQVKYQDIEV